MNEPFISRLPSHHLDPGAQEFFPSLPPQIFIPYPPPAYDSMIGYGRPPFSSVPAFVSAAVEPPPPLPVFVPPSSATPSRTLLLSMVPASVSESTVRRELEVFGDVRAVQMERRREGLVTVHFYDVRDAQAALGAIQEQHMQQQFRIGRHYDAVLNSSVAFMSVSPPPLPQTARGLVAGRVVWAQFTTPVTSGLPDGNNQGTLILFNLDPRVSPSYLREIFESFGPVKELRETPYKRNQRFVEFYDVRNAAMAMSEMNGRVIYGKAIVIEFSRPGGQSKKFWKGHDQNNGASSKTNLPQSPPRANKPFFRQPPPQRLSNDYRRNPSGSDGSKSWSSGSSSLHGSMANLSVNNSGYHEECSNSTNNSKYAQKKKNQYFKKVNNNSSASDSGGGCGTISKQHWKGGSGGGGGGGGGRRGKDDHDPRFLINEDAIVESNCRDTRTTVMIKNIPNKYR